MEENQNQPQETPQIQQQVKEEKDYSQVLQEINTNLKSINTFLENEKKETLAKEQQQKKIDEKKELKLKEDKKVQEKKEVLADKEKHEFYDNIKTICENSKSETLNNTTKDLSSLVQVSIITNGLIIGILCISLFAKFFKKNS